LRTVLAVETIRSVNGRPKVEAEIRYFLSSCRDDPATLGRAIRAHWGIENALHWVLDVTFREDDSRVRDRRAARNLALLPGATHEGFFMNRRVPEAIHQKLLVDY
jgi:predicted transposase YbfD/YdcC